MSSYRKTVLDTFVFTPRPRHTKTQFDATSLAFYLGFSGKALWFAVRNRDQLYTTFKKPKASGGERVLHNPNPFMRVIGKQLRAKILTPLCDKLGPHVTAYRNGRSTVHAAKRHLADCATCAVAEGPHTCSLSEDTGGHVRRGDTATCVACQPVPKHVCARAGVKIHMDLSDFFGSTRRSWIRQYFEKDLGYTHHVASLLAQLLTVTLDGPNGRKVSGVPQGGKASGDITNLIADARLDQPMLSMLMAENETWTYSRYADDLYFSCNKNLSFADVNTFLTKVRDVVRKSGYRVNEKKTHVQRPHKQQRLLGVVLNKKINIPRDDYRRFRAILHRCWHDGFEMTGSRIGKAGGELQGWLEGHIAYFENLNADRARELRLRYAAACRKHPSGSEMTFTFGKVVAS